MKNTKYKVIFFSGDEENYYCMSVLAAFCAATYDKNQKGRDARIKYIHDEDDNLTHSHFEFNYQTK